MGYYPEYQAFPYDEAFFEKIRSDEAFAEFYDVGDVCEAKTHDERMKMVEEYPHLLDVVKLIEPHKGIETRRFSGKFTSIFEELVYLLAKERCNWASHNENAVCKSVLGRAVLGADIIAPHAESVEGIPAFYMHPDETAAAADAFASINEDTLRERFRIPELIAEDVLYDYRYNCPEASPQKEKEFYDKELAFCIWVFNGLKPVYTQAAQHGEGVLMMVN